MRDLSCVSLWSDTVPCERYGYMKTRYRWLAAAGVIGLCYCCTVFIGLAFLGEKLWGGAGRYAPQTYHYGGFPIALWLGVYWYPFALCVHTRRSGCVLAVLTYLRTLLQMQSTCTGEAPGSWRGWVSTWVGVIGMQHADAHTKLC